MNQRSIAKALVIRITGLAALIIMYASNVAHAEGVDIMRTVNAIQTCTFSVEFEGQGIPVTGLAFNSGIHGTERVSGSGEYVLERIDGYFRVNESRAGFYTVMFNLPDVFRGDGWVELYESNPNICVGALAINAETCGFQAVLAAAGDCHATDSKVETASGAKGDSKSGSKTFDKDAKNQEKAVAVNAFLTTDLGISAKAAATLCAGDCANAEDACFPDSLEDVPQDGCELTVVAAEGGKSKYKLNWVSDGVHDCKIRALSCGCYKKAAK